MRGSVGRGFTLTELLVTILLIALLLGILLPALRGAREAADQVACLAHQAGNGKSILLYTYENDEAFPPFAFGFSPGKSGRIVVNVNARPMKDSGLDRFDPQQLVCPQDDVHGTVPVLKSRGRGGPPVRENLVVSYGYNVDLPVNRPRVSDVRSPSETIVLYDGSMSGGGGPGRDIRGSYADAWAFFQVALWPRHQGDSEWVGVFADWHAEVVEKPAPESVME